MTRKIAIAFAAMLALSGCASEAELQAQDQAACSSYGFQPGTVPYSTCLQNQAFARQYYWDEASAYPYGYADYGYPLVAGYVGGGWHGGRHWAGHAAGGWAGGAHMAGGFHGGGGGGHR